uniref:Uncharacterized protein n=1 Tax=Hyaloperonospora arabidopsidis (strain Emoy2) TaxID=559515 RepID=M4C3Y1_HYAAE
MIVKIKSRPAATAVRLFSPDDTLGLYFLYRLHDEPRFDAGRKRNCVRLWKICSVGSRSGHVHEQQRQNVRRTSTLDMRVKDNCLLSLALTTRAADVDSPSKRYVNVTLWELYNCYNNVLNMKHQTVSDAGRVFLSQLLCEARFRAKEEPLLNMVKKMKAPQTIRYFSCTNAPSNDRVLATPWTLVQRATASTASSSRGALVFGSTPEDDHNCDNGKVLPTFVTCSHAIISAAERMETLVREPESLSVAVAHDECMGSVTAAVNYTEAAGSQTTAKYTERSPI